MTAIAEPTTAAAPARPAPPIAPADTLHPDEASAVRWHRATRVAFRFAVVYFGLYVLLTQMLQGVVLLPMLSLPVLGSHDLVQPIVAWTGTTILGLPSVTFTQSGSGDTLYDWVLTFTILLVALVATALWSLRSRADAYPRLHKWFRLLMRLALGTTMLTYGFVKLVPLQMSQPGLLRLLEPFGDFSPMGVLWSSVGASPAYEMFIGAAEIGAGLLVLLPRTVMLGALLCLMDGIGIFAMNMTYDVPVKLFAFHIILFSLVLLAPDARRLVAFARGTSVPPAREPVFGRTPGTQRLAAILQVLFVVYASSLMLYQNLQGWKQYGGGAPKSPLYGIWAVRSLETNGTATPLLVTDSALVKHVIFQSPAAMGLQLMNDKFARLGAEIDTTTRTITLTGSTAQTPDTPVTTPPSTPPAKHVLTYERPAFDSLVLAGTLGGKQVRLALKRRDPDAFLLRSRGFHWVQERPYNR